MGRMAEIGNGALLCSCPIASSSSRRPICVLASPEVEIPRGELGALIDTSGLWTADLRADALEDCSPREGNSTDATDGKTKGPPLKTGAALSK